ncbi:3-hydroxybutyryl-dehydrogenase [Phaffia rhodozyma]|uniref:3-hydroxybutyryl-dehydrogenase n=1 Tax=Phaffia rhodozyma TaxID=264483 RepID=A0A0F7STN1_PHARH|nr:3-hydroxybutyryl-dehydrogenase [Phaffia rhodozyma]
MTSIIRRVGIVGGGQMGMGIALVSALKAKADVTLYDPSSPQLQKGLKFIDSLLEKDVNKGRLTNELATQARARISVIDNMKSFDDVGLVMEAAPESLKLKSEIFASLSSILPKETILATNTSSISISKIASMASNPERVVGIHWFNPVPVMPLVELIPALQTSEQVVQISRQFAEACGKEVTVSKDVPGFVGNAVLIPFLNEAIMTLERGVATKEDIDKTFILGMGHKMGPLTLADFIGLDTCLAIQKTMYTETGDSKYRPSILLSRMVDAGWYGKKSGKGFYDYSTHKA